MVILMILIMNILARNSQIQNYIYLKGGDVIHLPDNSLNQVHVIGEATNPISIN